jgi:hypothetical protein
MPQARINGQTVEVTKAGNEEWEVVYTVSGEGAAGIHATLMDLSAEPSLLVDGQFTISKAALTFDNMPFLKTLDRKLDAAASGLEVK